MKKSFNRVLMLGLVLILGFTVFMATGCESDEEEIEKQEVVIAGGTSGTTGCTYATAIKEWLKECYSEDETIYFKGNAEDNPVIDMRHIGNGEAGLAMISGDILSYAAQGDTYFDSPITNYTVLAECFTTDFQLIVRSDSSIKALSDLSGKTVYCGEEGSATSLNFEKIMETAGLDMPELKYMGYGDAVNALTEGDIDAIFVLGDAPLKKILKLAATDGIRLISLDEELIDSLCDKNYYYSKEEIPADSYQGQSEAVFTLGLRTYLIAGNTALAEDQQAEFLDKIEEGLETMTESCPAVSEFKAIKK